MKKYLSILISVLSLIIVFSVVGVGFGAWYFFEPSIENNNTNIIVTSYIDFNGLSLDTFKIPSKMAIEDPLSENKESNTGIYFLNSDNKISLHASGSTSCSDIVYFKLAIDEDVFTDQSIISASDFDTYLGLKVNDSLTKYLDFNGYLYESQSNPGKEITLTKSGNYFLSEYYHLEEIITFVDKSTTFNNITNLEAFMDAANNATLEVILTIKEAS